MGLTPEETAALLRTYFTVPLLLTALLAWGLLTLARSVRRWRAERAARAAWQRALHTWEQTHTPGRLPGGVVCACGRHVPTPTPVRAPLELPSPRPASASPRSVLRRALTNRSR